VDADVTDTTLVPEGSVALPSGSAVTFQAAASRWTTTNYVHVELATKGGEGVPIPLALALSTELRTPVVGPLLEGGSVTGTLVVDGPSGARALSGNAKLAVLGGQTWDLDIGTAGAATAVAAVTASCTNGRLERLFPLFSPDLAERAGAFAPRLPFSGKVRWLVGRDGTQRSEGTFSFLRGGLDVPAVGAAPTPVTVLGGNLSVAATTSTTGGRSLTASGVVRVRSPVEEVDPSPLEFRLTNLEYGDDDLSVDELALKLFGEDIVVKGRVERISTLGKLAVEIPRSAYPLERLARKLLPDNAEISLSGTLTLAAALRGTLKYPDMTGELILENVAMKSYYQKGIPLSFDRAKATLTIDDVLFTPFPVRLGMDDTVFPVRGGLKQVLGVDDVWPLLARTPMVAWRRIVEHVGNLDTQNIMTRAMGRESFGTIMRSTAHRIVTNVWTETRRDAYTYEAFLTDQESLEFDGRATDVVERYELVAKRNLAAKEGFSTSGFGADAFRMLRIKNITSSVFDRHGNQVWPEHVPKWRLDRTPGAR